MDAVVTPLSSARGPTQNEGAFLWRLPTPRWNGDAEVATPDDIFTTTVKADSVVCHRNGWYLATVSTRDALTGRWRTFFYAIGASTGGKKVICPELSSAPSLCEGRVTTMSASPSGSYILLGYEDGSVGFLVAAPEHNTQPAWRPVDLAVANETCGANASYAWRGAAIDVDKAVESRLFLHRRAISAFAWPADEAYAAVGSFDSTVSVIPTSYFLDRSPAATGSEASGGAAAGNQNSGGGRGKALPSSSAYVAALPAVSTLYGALMPITGLAFVASAQLVVTSADGSCRLYDVATKELVSAMTLHCIANNTTGCSEENGKKKDGRRYPTAVTMLNQQGPVVFIGCNDGTLWTADLESYRRPALFGRTLAPTVCTELMNSWPRSGENQHDRHATRLIPHQLELRNITADSAEDINRSAAVTDIVQVGRNVLLATKADGQTVVLTTTETANGSGGIESLVTTAAFAVQQESVLSKDLYRLAPTAGTVDSAVPQFDGAALGDLESFFLGDDAAKFAQQRRTTAEALQGEVTELIQVCAQLKGKLDTPQHTGMSTATPATDTATKPPQSNKNTAAGRRKRERQ